MAVQRGFPLDLVDQLIQNLDNSQDAMRSCALVSTQWLPLARYHIFRTIRFNNPQLGVLDRSIPRLQSVLEKNPDLSKLIRELSINWSVALAALIVDKIDLASMSRLETISFNFISWVQVSEDAVNIVGTIFELPSLKHLTLHSVTFENVEQFASFFHLCRSNVEMLTFTDVVFVRECDLDTAMKELEIGDQPRVALKSLKLSRGSLGHIVPWFLHTNCPISLRTLQHLAFDGESRLPVLVELLRVAGPSLKSLAISSPWRRLSSDYIRTTMLIKFWSGWIGTEDVDIGPTTLPDLLHLTILNIHHGSLRSTIELLNQLGPESRVGSIVLVMDLLKHQANETDDGMFWERIDEILDHLPASLKSVEVVVKNKLEEAGMEHAVDNLRSKFRRMDSRHTLQLR